METMHEINYYLARLTIMFIKGQQANNSKRNSALLVTSTGEHVLYMTGRTTQLQD